MAARQGREALGRAAAAPAAGEEVEERGMGAEHGEVAAARERSDGWRRARGRAGGRARLRRGDEVVVEVERGAAACVERNAARMTRGARETCVFLFFFNYFFFSFLFCVLFFSFLEI